MGRKWQGWLTLQHIQRWEKGVHFKKQNLKTIFKMKKNYWMCLKTKKQASLWTESELFTQCCLHLRGQFYLFPPGRPQHLILLSWQILSCLSLPEAKLETILTSLLVQMLGEGCILRKRDLCVMNGPLTKQQLWSQPAPAQPWLPGTQILFGIWWIQLSEHMFPGSFSPIVFSFLLFPLLMGVRCT